MRLLQPDAVTGRRGSGSYTFAAAARPSSKACSLTRVEALRQRGPDRLQPGRRSGRSRWRAERAQQRHVQAAACWAARPRARGRARSARRPSRSSGRVAVDLDGRQHHQEVGLAGRDHRARAPASPKRTSVLTEPPRWLMPWISAFFTSRPARKRRVGEDVGGLDDALPAQAGEHHVHHPSAITPPRTAQAGPRRAAAAARSAVAFSQRRMSAAARMQGRRATMTDSSGAASRSVRSRSKAGGSAYGVEHGHARHADGPGHLLDGDLAGARRGPACGRCRGAPAGRSWRWCRCRGPAPRGRWAAGCRPSPPGR